MRGYLFTIIHWQIFIYIQESPDSAIKYFQLAEYDLINKFDKELISYMFYGTATAYRMLNEWPKAIAYYTKAFNFFEKQKNISSLADVSDSLSFLYSQIGDYKQTYKYSSQSTQYKNEFQKRSNSNDIALLGVVRENRLHEEELKLNALKLRRDRNIQYMFITISICIVFIDAGSWEHFQYQDSPSGCLAIFFLYICFPNFG